MHSDRIYELHARWEWAQEQGTPFDLEQEATPEERAEFQKLRESLNSGPESENDERRVPNSIGRYQFESYIAGGAMGKVFLGKDTLLGRRVAIKVMRRTFGISSHQFQEEARLAARLSHPGIVPVHDFGELDDGRPFFVMKLVEGGTFEEVLKANTQPEFQPRAIQYFEQICQAVAYAHSQNPPLLHRDLKPQNVMIGAYGEVLVMDWGIARSLSPRSSTPVENVDELRPDSKPIHLHSDERQSPDQTRIGIARGTWEYMSPEQARGERDQICPASDVFALGGILCRILTGTPPFTGEDHQRRAMQGDLRETISRLNGCGAEAELIELAKRCLAALPDERPASGLELAELVTAYRAGVDARLHQARADEAAARARETEQRKRRKSLQWAGGAIALVLLLGTLGTTIGLIQADRQRDRAIQAAENEKTANELTGRRLEQIETINNSVFDLFEDFDIRKVKDGPDPVEFVLAQRLVNVGRKLDARAIDDPLVLANLLNRLGHSLVNLGEFRAAIEFLAASLAIREVQLGPDHPDALRTRNNLARSHQGVGNLDDAIPMFEETLRLRKESLGVDHIDTLNSMNDLAMAYRADRKLTRALPLLEETVRRTDATLEPHHSLSLTSKGNLAAVYRVVRDLDRALPLLVETFEGMKKQYGPDHPDTLTAMSNLGLGYLANMQNDLAVPLLEKTLERRRDRLGPSHARTLVSMGNLAEGYGRQGKLKLALPLLDKNYSILKATQGDKHPLTLTSLNNRAAGYLADKQYAKAIELFEKHLELTRDVVKNGHLDLLESVNNLAIAYCTAGLGDKALPLFAELTNATRSRLSGNPSAWASIQTKIGLYLLAGKQFAAAEGRLREALEIRKRSQPEKWDTFHVQSLLGYSLFRQKKYTEAEPLLVQGYEGMKVRDNSIPKEEAKTLPEALDRLIDFYTETNNPEKKKKWEAERKNSASAGTNSGK